MSGETRAACEHNGSHFRLLALLATLLALTVPSLTWAQDPCEVDDTGGTVILPPEGCEYLTADEVHMIIDGLPGDATIEFAPIHKDFICGEAAYFCDEPPPGLMCETAGGSLGGNTDCSFSTLEFQVTGTGSLAGFSRFISIQTLTEISTAPRTPGDPVQDFDTEIHQISGELFGDPDFCVLRIRAGDAFGLPSLGHTTLTQLPSGRFDVDSFFDIHYEISFQGCPGSILEGFGGTTLAHVRMETGINNPLDVPSSSRWGLMALAGLLVLSSASVYRYRRDAR